MLNSKFSQKENEYETGRIIHEKLGFLIMKSYKNIYPKLCSYKNLEKAFNKAKKGKSSIHYVIEFSKNKIDNFLQLKKELKNFTYKPNPLKRFIIRDPKTRTIHASAFRDRVVYHVIVNILEPIFEKIFIYDSYASRKNKGTLKAIIRFDEFKRKISKNNNINQGYVLKADIKHYFQNVDHEILLSIIKEKIKDENVLWLIRQILNNFDAEVKGKGMPLGNLTSQFFANVYLNKFDYFVKYGLKAKYYIRYVDDFVILHNNREILEEYKNKINIYLKELKLELHPDKSKIIPLKDGITFLGYRIFYHYKLLKENNIRKFKREFNKNLNLYKNNLLDYNDFVESLQGWFGYSMHADTYKFRKDIMKRIKLGNK